MVLKLLFIAAGGAVGAVTRYTVGLGLHHLLGSAFPYGTLAVNVVGCFLLATLAEMKTHEVSAHVREAIAVGFLGALTTFSTFGFETLKYGENNWTTAVLNVAANLLLGLLAVKLGLHLGAGIRG